MSVETVAPRSGGAELVAFALRITLAVLFLSVFASNIHKGLYSPHGYAGLIRSYADRGNAPGFWKDLMRFIADHAAIFSKLQAATELGFGLALLFGIATRIVGVAAGFYLASLWLSEIGYPTEWIWSLIFPTLMAFCVALLSAGRVYGLDGVLRGRLPRWATG